VIVSAYIVLSLVCMSVFLVWLPIPACIPEAFKPVLSDYFGLPRGRYGFLY